MLSCQQDKYNICCVPAIVFSPAEKDRFTSASKRGIIFLLFYALLFNDFADCDFTFRQYILPGRIGDLYVNSRAFIVLLDILFFNNCLATSAIASKDSFCSHLRLDVPFWKESSSSAEIRSTDAKLNMISLAYIS